MINQWIFHAKNISKKPRLLKHFGKKYILIANRGSFPFNKRTEAIRYIKKTREYRERVNKPIIKLIIVN